MELLNKKVSHGVFGIGIVTEVYDKDITVQFTNISYKFQFPEAFKNFLKAVDPKLHEEIMKLLDPVPPLSPEPPISPIPSRKRNIFYVFQGKTFNIEVLGEYIWAPIETKSGHKPHHWTRLLDVREGDIILHGNKGYICAISIARGACYNCPKPIEIREEDLW